MDREASDKEKEKDLPTFKDNDFVKEGMKIYIGEEAKEKLHETLNADVGVSLFFCEVGLLINVQRGCQLAFHYLKYCCTQHAA